MSQDLHQPSALLLCDQGEFAVSERYLTMDQLCSALEQQRVKEVFGTGTACMICHLSQIVYKGEVKHTVSANAAIYVHAAMGGTSNPSVGIKSRIMNHCGSKDLNKKDESSNYQFTSIMERVL